MALFHDSAIVGASGNQGGAGGYQISRSLRFNSSDSAYLSRTPASAGNRKTWTFSFWTKRSNIVTRQLLLEVKAGLNDTDYFSIEFTIDTTAPRLAYGGWNTTWGLTRQVFRDVSAWYHIVLAVDTTQSTANNRIKLYVNGAQVTNFDIEAYPAQNADTGINATSLTTIGSGTTGSNSYSGYLADIHFIDGQALTPSSFAETNATTGQWVPKAYTGSYGTNGFQLKFADNSNNTAATLGKDTSGNGNNWTPNNLSVTAGAGNDSLVDTPTSYGTDTGTGGEVRGNYATLNPLSNSTGRYTLSDGNLKIAATDAFNAYVSSTIALPASGQFYFEYTCTNTSTSQLRDAVGFVQNSLAQTYLGNSGTLAYEGYVGTVVGVATGNYSTWGNNDVIGIAVDCSTGKVWFSKNNTWQNSGSPTGGTGQVATLTNITNWIPACGAYAGSQFNYTANGYINFGQRPFAYTAPSGFKALCDTNLPAPVVAKPDTVMDVKLWTGDGASSRSLTGLNFSPDFLWIKSRNQAYNHTLFDAIRGAGSQKALYSNTTQSEATGNSDTTYGYLSSFDSSGFSVEKGSSSSNSYTNHLNDSYIAWAFDAGSSTVSNTQGSITSQVRANASAGFSIVTYTGNATTGATVGHGLGVAPRLIIAKRRDGAVEWPVYHASAGAGYYLYLNTTAAAVANTVMWNNTTPSSSTFSIGNYSDINANTGTYVAYCFAPVAGYSSFGSYTGNGSSDGPFVYTGFRPAFVLVKGTGNGLIWTIEDNKRDTYNGTSKYLQPQSSDAEGSVAAPHYDFTSNGFKIRTTDSAWNQNGITYIYAAFAESPFQYARAR